MAKLFNSITDVKAYCANSFTKEFTVLEPYLDIAEEDITTKYLGKSQFDSIVTFYANGSPGTDADKLKLYHYIRSIVANHALTLYIPIGNVQMSEAGIHILSGEDKKTAFEWQIDKLISSIDTIIATNLEAMLVFLESKTDVFTAWKTSTLYASLVGLLVNKATIMNNWVNINNSRLTFIDMLPDIRNSEDLLIIPSISQKYYDLLITEIKAVNVSADNKIVLQILQAALCNFAAASYYDRTNKEKTTRFDNIANKYLNKAIEYLNTNASEEKYKTYFDSDVYTAPADYSTSFFDNKEDNSIFVM